MKYVAQWLVLQSILVAAMVVAYMGGVLDEPFAGHSAPVCVIILGMGALGLALALKQRWKDVEWIATHVVRIGLLGTVVGLILAFSIAGQAGDAADVKPLIAQVIQGMYVALYATLLGIGTNLWLKINLKLLGRDMAVNRIRATEADCKSGSGATGRGSSKPAGLSAP